jgi:hypothetical protein
MKDIFKNLLFVKHETIKMVEYEKEALGTLNGIGSRSKSPSTTQP